MWDCFQDVETVQVLIKPVVSKLVRDLSFGKVKLVF